MKIKEAAKRLQMSERWIKQQTNNANNISEDDLKVFSKKFGITINPEDRKRKEDKLPKIISLSFFTGAMGLDIGMKKAGINPLLVSEIDKDTRATIVENDPTVGLIGDIWKYNASQIKEYANIPKNQKIDVIFGGPPCQSFSTAGKRKGFTDKRGSAYIRYLDIIEELKPKYAIIENVRGLKSAKAILNGNDGFAVKGGVLYYTIKRFERLGYSVSFNLYNSANFGAPQKRERFIIIAKLGSKKVNYLTPTNSNNLDNNLPKWKTLGDAILDIQNKDMHYIDIPKSRKQWYKKIPEGGNWKSLSIEDQKLAMGKKIKLGGGKTGFFRRLDFNKPSPTLVTVPTMPATELIHPKELRPLSIEEYARVQGFPDNWKFKGKILSIYKQIGNAVPIKLGEAIGKTIINDINGKEICNLNSKFKYSRYKNTSDKSFLEFYNKNLKKNKYKQLSFNI